MKIDSYLFHNPETEAPERVYKFPWFMVTANEKAAFGGNLLYSRKPLERPLINIGDVYLTRIKGGQLEVPYTGDYLECV